MNTVIYSIPAIHCNHCVHTIKMEIGDLEGVKAVEADANTRKATITFDLPATEEKIKAVLAEINYPVAG